MSNITTRNGGRYLAGNPIIVGIRGKHYSIKEISTNKILFKGVSAIYRYDSPRFESIDISDLFRSKANKAGIYEVEIEIGITTTETKRITIYGGGISQLLTTHLDKLGENIFDAKLKNNDKNFFLTSRTTIGKSLFIPEDELRSLYYYSKGMRFDVVDNTNQTLLSIDHTTLPTERVDHVDLEQIRKQELLNNGKLISEFRFVKDNETILQVYITPPDTESKYSLSFINSWGVFEEMQIHGEIEYQPEIATAETTTTYDPQLERTITNELRKKTKHKYKINLGLISEIDTPFIIDLLQSPRIHFNVKGGEFYEAFISADNNIFARTNGTPSKVTCTITLENTEQYSTPFDIEEALLNLTSQYQNILSQNNKIQSSI